MKYSNLYAKKNNYTLTDINSTLVN